VMAYTQLIEKLGLSAQVQLENRYIPDEEIGLYFSSADVFVAPYVGGTQSAAVKVALGFDLPIVISRAIASKELENDSTHCLYWVDPKDVHALADAIERSLRENASTPRPLTLSSGGDEWEELAAVIETAAIV
jgi:glycosyltransferase involved in cell wall biosynthesis